MGPNRERVSPVLLEKFFPEAGAGGFSRVDGTVDFYTRVNALLRSDSVVVDFGAGRGQWSEDPIEFRRELQRLQGKVRKVIGVDVDQAVMEHPSLDEAVIYAPGTRLPLCDESVDLIVSDYTFEHVDDPSPVAKELTRILRPGGWICARTPNRWGYIALGARLIPNVFHKQVLEQLQPGREARDVFPTRYRMNTRRVVLELFPPGDWDDHSYTSNSEPAYFGNLQLAWRAMNLISKVAPRQFAANRLVFLHKR